MHIDPRLYEQRPKSVVKVTGQTRQERPSNQLVPINQLAFNYESITKTLQFCVEKISELNVRVQRLEARAGLNVSPELTTLKQQMQKAIMEQRKEMQRAIGGSNAFNPEAFLDCVEDDKAKPVRR